MSLSSPPLVSIVTPCHNTAPYLPDCIESVLRQTYGNWEYVIQDNGSTDGSLEIAQRYARLDGRIRVISTGSLLPQVPNYNLSLKHIAAASVYCKIAQADDWLFADCIDRMVAVAETDSRIGIVGAYTLVGNLVECDGLPMSRGPIPGAEACRLYLLGARSVFGSPTSVLFRSDVVRSREKFFSETSHFEDLEVCFDILEHHEFGFVNQVLTFARTDNESITGGIRPYNPYLACQYAMLLKYGPRFLTTSEYAARHAELEQSYYGFLANALATGQTPAFWRFHREVLESVGARFEMGRVRRRLIRRGFDALLRPTRVLTRGFEFLSALRSPR